MLKTFAAAGIAGSLVFLVPGSPGPPPQGGERHVRFVNDSREPITELYVSAVGADDWHGDLLGEEYLAPGGSVLVEIVDRNQSCRADIRIVRDDGSELVGRAVDICRAAGDDIALR